MHVQGKKLASKDVGDSLWLLQLTLRHILRAHKPVRFDGSLRRACTAQEHTSMGFVYHVLCLLTRRGHIVDGLLTSNKHNSLCAPVI